MEINVIGLMSGTSLDGLDICYVNFKNDSGKWSYKIIKAISESYPQEIKYKLSEAQNMSALDYARFHSDYGLYIGQRVKKFIEDTGVKPDLVASHGHTIFHQPDIRFTAQIGSGAGIAAESGVDTVCDFRTKDVALYGQGAPLVPIGDKTLFSEYDYCLNLGGFSNISYTKGDERIAFDISPVNYVLNHYTRSIGLDYDEDGRIARSGKVSPGLYIKLNNLDFYKMSGPKSLGREWVEEVVIPLIDSFNISMEDKLATLCEHVAQQVSLKIEGGKVLLTGGGAFNKYLTERMAALSPQCQFVIPDAETINFKEALIFAFLGALYMSDTPNCLASVTGASRDNIGGCLYKKS